MNVACIPYHDWRKIEMEGSRTRDSHVISHLEKSDSIERLFIINRPATVTELILKKKNRPISGRTVCSHGSWKVYEVGEGIFVFDYISRDYFGPVFKKKVWFFESFGAAGFLDALQEALAALDLKVDIVLSQNIFSAKLLENWSVPAVFDAWDNFILFPENKRFKEHYYNAYKSLAKTSKAWITNSPKNVDYYNKNYEPKECFLIKNGVDIDKFRHSYAKPSDLSKINGPIVGFGGKITHLFNYEFFNYAVEQHPDKSFVIVGQVLDPKVFDKIVKAKNLHYLGDKHYSDYVKYVTNFDIGIVPYVTDELEHGADSIKVYEYLASGLKVVGTSGAGMNDLSEYLFIATDKEEFSLLIGRALEVKEQITLPDFHTWSSKTNEIVQILQDNCL